MGKIGDLFVRLGLKKDDYSKGLKEAKAEGASFGKSLSVIGSKAKLAFGVAVAAVAGFVKALKDLGEQNQTLGDEIARTGAGLSAMWDATKTALASLDFSNFIGNLREAYRLASNLYDAMDAMGEIETAYNIALNQQRGNINDLLLKLRNANLSDQERIEAGQKLLKIYEELEKNPTRGLERLKDATLDKYMQRMGVNMKNRTDSELAAMRKKYTDFFIWIASAEGEKYAEAATKVKKSGGLDSYWGKTVLANARNAGMEEQFRLAYAYVNKMGDKQRVEVEKAVTDYLKQQEKSTEETLRVQTLINSVIHQREESNARAADEQQRLLDADRKKAEDVLKRAEDSAKGEVQLLYEKYQQEKELLIRNHKDTTALTEEFNRNLNEIMSKALDVKVPVEIDFVFPNEEDLSAEIDEIFKWATDPIIENVENITEHMKWLAEEFQDAIINGFSAGIQELTDQIFGLTEINPGRVFQALLEPFADLAIKEGQIIMASGLGIEALKDSLTAFEGIGAVVAGGALVAIGAAAKSGLADLAQTGGRATAATTYGSSSGSTGQQNLQTEMTIYVKGSIRGSDIVLSGQKTVSNWGR